MSLGSNRNLLSIQALRFWAALMVVIHHSINDLTQKSGIEGGKDLREFFYFGASGVQVFFVISGFVMMVSSERLFQIPGAWRAFLYRRLIRIYPIYFICVILNILIRSLWGQIIVSGGAKLLGALLLFPGLAGSIIVPGWTLSYEMYFYLLFAAALVFRPRQALIILSSFFLLCILSAKIIDLNAENAIWVQMQSPLLLDFVVGAWLGWLVKLSPEQWRVPPLVSCIVLALSVVALLANFILSRYLPYMITFGIPSACIVASCVFLEKSGFWHRLFARFTRLGDASYSLYLIHQLVLILIVPQVAGFVSGRLSFAFLIILLVAASLISGFLLFVLVEKPILQRLRGIQRYVVPSLERP